MKKVLLGSMLFCALLVRGAVVLTEPFNYPNGSQIAVEPGWGAHSGAGSGSQIVTNKSLHVVFTSQEDTDVLLPNSPYNGTATGNPLVASLYVSMVLTFDALPGDTNALNNNYFAHFWDSSTGIGQVNGFRCRLFAYTNGAPTGQLALGLTSVGGTVTNSDYIVNTNTFLTTNTPYTVVMRLGVNDGNSQMWINPNQESDASVLAAGPGTAVDLAHFCFRQVGGTGSAGSVLVKNLKVGTLFTDVAGTNTPPSVSGIPTRVDLPANTSTPLSSFTVPFTVGDDHNPASSIATSVSSTNSQLFPSGSLVLSTNTPDGTNRTLTITPALNRQGNSSITLIASNPGGASNVVTFRIYVGAPSISAIPSQLAYLGGAPTVVNFQVSDHETAAKFLNVTASSSNPSVVASPAGIQLASDSTGTNRTVTLTQAGQAGLTTISIFCSDGNNTVTNTFTFDVSPSYGMLFQDNFDSYSDGSYLSFIGDVSGGVWHTHSGTPYQLYASNHAAYVSSPTTNSEDIHATLLDTPLSTTGGAVVYYGFSLNQLSLPTTENGDYFIHLRDTNTTFHARLFACRTNAAANTFRLGISSGAAFPTAVFPLDLVTNNRCYVVVRYNVGSGETVLWVNPTSQSSQNVVANDTTTAPSEIDDICLRESGGSTTPSAAGSQVIDDLKVSTSYSDVAPTIFPPTISAIANQNIAVSGSTGPIAFTVYDAQNTPDTLSYTLTSDNTSLLPLSNIVLGGGSSTNRTMTITPVAGQSGFANVTLTVTDSLSLSSTRAFLVTVGNPPTNGIVISQFYPGGGNTGATYNSKFVELFNKTATPVSLNNWSLQYASSTGTSWTVAPFNNITVAAYSYYLVALNVVGTNGTALPAAADFTMSSINPSQSVGKLALCNSTTPLSGATPLPNSKVADFIGYGTGTSAYEGSGPVAWVSDNTMAMYRANGGCTDTDNNASDFSSALVSPHNSASGQNICQSAPPVMRAFINGNSFVIAWPTAGSSGFNLETATTVNQVSWTVAGSPTVVGSENQVSVPIGGAAQYFRLKK